MHRENHQRRQEEKYQKPRRGSPEEDDFQNGLQKVHKAQSQVDKTQEIQGFQEHQLGIVLDVLKISDKKEKNQNQDQEEEIQNQLTDIKGYHPVFSRDSDAHGSIIPAIPPLAQMDFRRLQFPMAYFGWEQWEKSGLEPRGLSALVPDPSLRPVPTDLAPRLDRPGRIRAVLLDIYGTLVISQSGDVGTAESSGEAEAFRRTLEAFELYPSSLAEQTRELYFRCIRESHEASRRVGIDYPEVDIISIWHRILLELAPALNRPLEPDISLAAGMALFYENLQNATAPMPGLKESLGRLKNAGLALGIISNAQFYTPPLLASCLDTGSLEDFFHPELLLWSYREGRAKPSQELFRRAAGLCRDLLDIPPEEILYAGNDMRNDIFPAAREGFRTALFAGDRRSLRLREKDPLYSYIKPDIIITELEQLPDLLLDKQERL